MNSNETREQRAVKLLKEIVEWWDEWNNSDNPTEIDDPPIEEARDLVLNKTY